MNLTQLTEHQLPLSVWHTYSLISSHAWTHSVVVVITYNNEYPFLKWFIVVIRAKPHRLYQLSLPECMTDLRCPCIAIRIIKVECTQMRINGPEITTSHISQAKEILKNLSGKKKIGDPWQAGANSFENFV